MMYDNNTSCNFFLLLPWPWLKDAWHNICCYNEKTSKLQNAMVEQLKDEEEKCDGTFGEKTKFWPIKLEP